jgi:hypothetical protein
LVGKLCWLWVAATGGIAVFLTQAEGSAEALAALPGQTVKGLVCSDRRSACARLSPVCRQVLCRTVATVRTARAGRRPSQLDALAA